VTRHGYGSWFSSQLGSLEGILYLSTTFRLSTLYLGFSILSFMLADLS
jgi:hypothetical protein